jgi:hypothetical protein
MMTVAALLGDLMGRFVSYCSVWYYCYKQLIVPPANIIIWSRFCRRTFAEKHVHESFQAAKETEGAGTQPLRRSRGCRLTPDASGAASTGQTATEES